MEETEERITNLKDRTREIIHCEKVKINWEGEKKIMFQGPIEI